MKTLSFIALIILSAATVAYGRAPTLEELPSVKKIQEDADKAIEERRRAEIEAQKDPVMDEIHAYRDKNIRMDEWKRVTDILKDDRETPEHRRAAAEALCVRFKELDKNNGQIVKVKKDIGASLLNQLNDNNNGELRMMVYSVFSTFWPGTATKIGFNPEEPSPKRRYDGWKEWRKFLKSR
jgi:hypothetical protein